MSPELIPYALSELHFYAGADSVPVEGSYFDPVYADAAHFSPVRDHDLNTSVKGVPLRYSWLGFDAGENSQQLVKLRFAPINNANYVVKEQIYELCYWDNGNWVSSERKMATADYLDFDRVPTGALYWLKCLTEGREERIFTYRDGKQVWW